MKRFIIILGASSLLSCLPLEPIPGSSIWYNLCSNPIELRRDGIPEEIYKKKKKLVIDSGSSISGTFFPNKNTEKEAIKNYFIENGVKKRFKVDLYNNEKLNLIACPENAKPTGDGNWIKAN